MFLGLRPRRRRRLWRFRLRRGSGAACVDGPQEVKVSKKQMGIFIMICSANNLYWLNWLITHISLGFFCLWWFMVDISSNGGYINQLRTAGIPCKWQSIPQSNCLGCPIWVCLKIDYKEIWWCIVPFSRWNWPFGGYTVYPIFKSTHTSTLKHNMAGWRWHVQYK
jgi:hypothetical protein